MFHIHYLTYSIPIIGNTGILRCEWHSQDIHIVVILCPNNIVPEKEFLNLPIGVCQEISKLMVQIEESEEGFEISKEVKLNDLSRVTWFHWRNRNSHSAYAAWRRN